MVAAWLAGELLVVGVLAAAGALGGDGRTVTTIRNAAATTETVADTKSDGKGDEALYEETSPGVVEIKATIKTRSPHAPPATR